MSKYINIASCSGMFVCQAQVQVQVQPRVIEWPKTNHTSTLHAQKNPLSNETFTFISSLPCFQCSKEKLHIAKDQDHPVNGLLLAYLPPSSI